MNEKATELMKKARQARGLKQSDIAKKLNVKNATISSWEVGKADPDIESFVKYCNICGIDFTEILRSAYGDPQEKLETIECTADEIDMIKKFRFLDNRGKRNVLRNLNAEYEDAKRDFSEESVVATSTG